jgi:hypothetical protein
MRTLNLNVYLYFKNICVNKASGVDDINPKILKLSNMKGKYRGIFGLNIFT